MGYSTVLRCDENVVIERIDSDALPSPQDLLVKAGLEILPAGWTITIERSAASRS